MPAKSKTKCESYADFERDCQRLYPEYQVYGPYKRRADGRKIVILYDGKKRTARQYARILLEIKLGRRLSQAEEVDHKDGDLKNDDLSNLQVLTKRDNRRKAVIETGRQRKPETFTCPMCGKSITFSGRELNSVTWNRRRGSAGPFCGRVCAGKYGAGVQHGNIVRLGV